MTPPTFLNGTKPSYTLSKPLDTNLFLVRRSTDNELFLARPLDIPIPTNTNQTDDDNTNTNKNNNTNDDESTTTTQKLISLLHPPTPLGHTLLYLLNHDHLLSIHPALVTIPPAPAPAHLPEDENDDNSEHQQQQQQPTNTRRTRMMLLFDHCDLGTLHELLAEYEPELRAARAEEVGGFLPEGFVWHVALGVLRGLMWLHEGVRETVVAVGNGNEAGNGSPSSVGAGGGGAGAGEGGGGGGGGGRWGKGRGDNRGGGGRRRVRVRGRREGAGGWRGVLHQDVRAENVFLKQPRGIETYGAVKLGGFGGCWVAGRGGVMVEAPGGEDGSLVVLKEEKGEVDEPLVSLKEEEGGNDTSFVRQEGKGKDVVSLDFPQETEGERSVVEDNKSHRPYTQGSDLFAVGALLYRMMCGRTLPPADECAACGCVHLITNDAGYTRACNHYCVEDVHINDAFKPLFNYTADLKSLAALLLRLDGSREWWASDVLDIAWPGFENWTANTEDGRLYRDVSDDVRFREQNAAKFKTRCGVVMEEEENMELFDDILVV